MTSTRTLCCCSTVSVLYMYLLHPHCCVLIHLYCSTQIAYITLLLKYAHTDLTATATATIPCTWRPGAWLLQCCTARYLHYNKYSFYMRDNWSWQCVTVMCVTGSRSWWSDDVYEIWHTSSTYTRCGDILCVQGRGRAHGRRLHRAQWLSSASWSV